MSPPDRAPPELICSSDRDLERRRGRPLHGSPRRGRWSVWTVAGAVHEVDRSLTSIGGAALRLEADAVVLIEGVSRDRLPADVAPRDRPESTPSDARHRRRGAETGAAPRSGDQGVRFVDWFPLATQGFALAFWVWALVRIDLDAMTDTGLVSVYPVSYYVALAFLVVGLVVEVARPSPRPWVLAAAVAILVVVVHATIPILYEAPRYSYVYKHIGVTRYVESFGGVDRSIEIYQNWSGFPGAAAQLSSITSVDSLALANWALLFFAAANVLALRFAVRALTTDVRVVAMTATVYVLADWVGQAYFAPQSVAFLASLIAVGVVLRCIASGRSRQARAPGARTETAPDAPSIEETAEAIEATAEATRSRDPGLLTRLRRGFARLCGDLPADGRPVLRPISAIALTLVLTATVVLTHPLSPYLLIAWLAALVVLGRWRFWWLPVGALVMAILWTLAANQWLSAHVDLFGDVGSAADNASGTGGVEPGSAGRQLVGMAARLLSLGVWAAAALGATLRLSRGHRDMTAPALGLIPFGLVLAQSYGGEIIYRVYLFSLPWCCFLIASGLIVGVTRRRGAEAGRDEVERQEVEHRAFGWGRAVTVTVALGVLTALFLTAAFGLERVNRLQPEEVVAGTWFEQHAPPGSVLTQLAAGFPTQLTEKYSEFRTPWETFGVSVIDQDPRFKGRILTEEDIPTVIGYLQQFGSGDVYVAVGPSQVAYNEMFQLAPPGAVTRLAELLTAAPGVEVVYQSGDVTILKLPPPRSAGG